MNWRVGRTVGLWVLIICTIAMLGIMAQAGQWIWFTVFSVIALAVLLGEAYSYFFTKERITISTRYGRWIKMQPIRAYLALAFFVCAMLGLAVHLVGYAFK